MCGQFFVDEKPSSSESFQVMKSFPHIRLKRNNVSTFCDTVKDLKKKMTDNYQNILNLIYLILFATFFRFLN